MISFICVFIFCSVYKSKSKLLFPVDQIINFFLRRPKMMLCVTFPLFRIITINRQLVIHLQKLWSSGVSLLLLSRSLIDIWPQTPKPPIKSYAWTLTCIFTSSTWMCLYHAMLKFEFWKIYAFSKIDVIQNELFWIFVPFLQRKQISWLAPFWFFFSSTLQYLAHLWNS